MRTWRDATLGDVCELKRGYDLPAAQRERGAVPIVSSSGISGFHSVAKVHGPGVVTGRYGTLGQVFFLQEDFWPLNTALYVRDFKGNDPRFVAALLESLDLGRNDGASAVPGVNRNQLHGLAVVVPDPTEQARISSILGALDDLIENDRQRVELLEEMARAIYREWFVLFRYPGHENVPVVTSTVGPIPDGWNAVVTGDLVRAGVLEIGDGYRAKNSEMTDEASGLPFVRIGNVRDGYLELSGADRLPAGYRNRLKSKVSQSGDTVISMKGTIGRSALIDDHYPAVAYSPQVSYWRSLDRAQFSALYLYLWIHSDSFAQQCSAVKGATDMADYVNLTDQRRMLLLHPPQSVMASFSEAVEPLLGLAATLRRQANILEQLRNVLLPRLVSGRIDASSLDLDALVGQVAT